MYAARTGFLYVDIASLAHSETDKKGKWIWTRTHSSPVPGTKTVELLGFCFTLATARSKEAFRSLSNFVCCASLRSNKVKTSIRYGKWVAAAGVQPR